MLEESLGEGVAVQYLKDLNAAYLNHKNICDAALANDFSAVQLAESKTEAHQREAAQNNVNLKVSLVIRCVFHKFLPCRICKLHDWYPNMFLLAGPHQHEKEH